MTGIVSAITVLCASLFAAAVIKILAPSGSTEKILRLVIGMFVLLCAVACFKAVSDAVSISDINSIVSDNSSSELDESVEANVLKVTAEYIADYAHSLCSSESIDVNSVKATVNVNKESVINVSEICIYIDKSKEIYVPRINEIIEESFLLTPRIEVEE